MSILTRLERGIRGAMESVFGRAFGGGLQPTEIRRRVMIQAAASEQASQGGSRVANFYRVLLSPADLEALGPSLPALAVTLVEELEESAIAAGWETEGPFAVEFQPRPGFAVGEFEVVPEWRRGVAGWRLRVVSGPDHGEVYDVAGREIIIGRQPDVDVCLTDTDVSRYHAALRCDGFRLFLRDLGSTNGTYIAGRRIIEEELRPGARFEVGRCLIEVLRSRPAWEDGDTDRV